MVVEKGTFPKAALIEKYSSVDPIFHDLVSLFKKAIYNAVATTQLGNTISQEGVLLVSSLKTFQNTAEAAPFRGAFCRVTLFFKLAVRVPLN